MVFPNPNLFPQKIAQFTEKELGDISASGKLLALDDLFVQLNLVNPSADFP